MTGVEIRRDVTQIKRSLKILAIHRYYWPDTPPYASMLRQIVARWTTDGHHVDVLSSQPSYKASLDNTKRPAKESLDGATVQRMTLPGEAGRPVVRIVNALRLGAAIVWHALRRRYDVIMISTAPPVLGGVAASMAARLTGARFIYHCMDIHPEVGRVSGEFARPAVFKFLRSLDSFSCRRAEPVVVLSADMAQTLRARPQANGLNIEVINNFNLPSGKAVSENLPFNISSERLTVLFAGNVGRFQGLNAVVDAMAQLKDHDDIEFIIMGEGAAKAALMKKATDCGARIQFVDHQTVAVAKEAMRRVSYGFVSLVPDLFRYAFPSKTMTYLAQGCPLIVAVEKDSELAREAVAQSYGHWVPPDDGNALAKLLIRLADSAGERASMAECAKAKAARDFSEDVVLERWSRLLLPAATGDAQ